MEALSPLEWVEFARREPGLSLLDVREDHEWSHCRLPGSLHIPLGELVLRCEELDPERAWVVVCHHGVRSARAAALLRARGFARVYNLSGGLDRYSRDVDPAFPRY
jgi:rhodanese-related sulfurtransferase